MSGGFVVESVAAIVKDVVDKNLHYEVYDQGKIPSLTQSILTNTIEQLRDSNPNYKYIVNCAILQKGAAASGLHTQSSCLWDTKTDGSYTLRWENRHLHCILTVFGVVNTDVVSIAM